MLHNRRRRAIRQRVRNHSKSKKNRRKLLRSSRLGVRRKKKTIPTNYQKNSNDQKHKHSIIIKPMNEKVKKIVKWIAVIAAAIGAAAAVIMEQGCSNKYHLKANGIKIDTVEVSKSLKIK